MELNKLTKQLHSYREQIMVVGGRGRGWIKWVKMVKKYRLPVIN